MLRFSLLCLSLALAACAEPGPCDDFPGTCLNVYLQSASGQGERLDAVRFAVQGDGDFRHEHSWTAEAGGQLLPLTVPLPLPEEAQRTIKVDVAGLWNGRTLVVGSRVVSNLDPGDRRSVTISLGPPGGAGQCTDGVQNGGESGVDCGGTCAPCAPTCSDGVKNGGESDVDCGGACAPCYGEQACSVPADCISGRCEGGRCARAFGVASVVPDAGPTGGDIEVTVRGELLGAVTEVLFGMSRAQVLRAAPDGRSVTVALPPGAAGPVDVVVRAGGESATRRGAFAYHYGTLRFGTMPPTNYSPGNKPYYVLSGHFNRAIDMYLDLAVVNEFDDNVAIMLNRGDGTFMKAGSYKVGPREGAYPLMAAPGDFNGDGYTDLATPDHRTSTMSVLIGRGDGTFRTSDKYELPAGAAKATTPVVTAADFNGDSLDDVAAVDTGNGGKVYLWLANADRSGALLPPQLVPGINTGAGETDATLLAARLDGDTIPDLIVAIARRRTATVLLGGAGGTFRPAGEFPIGGVATFVLTVADWDRDGKPDVLSANRGSDDVSVLLGVGDGTLRPPKILKACQGPYNISLADLDGDGRLDIATPCYRDEKGGGNTVLLQFGDGRGNAARKLELTVPQTVYGMTAGDWSGDGRVDLATTSVAPSNVLTVLLNQSQ